MERKIGEIFEYNGEWYQCLKSPDGSCKQCDMNFGGKCPIPIKECTASGRSDKSYIVFKKLEKVGGPCKSLGLAIQNGVIVELYKTYLKPILPPNVGCILNDYLIAIEIKNKEDMEEKKPTYEELLHYYHSTVGLWAIDRSPQEVSLDWICDNAFQLGIDEKDSNSENIGKNLREFDLEAAKVGKPVCTRDGRKARIICFNRVNSNDYYRIVACVTTFDGNFEEVLSYSIDGYIISPQHPKNDDLMMLPEKKEGWVNVYRDEESKRVYCGESIFSEREKAEKHYECNDTKVATVPIRWEE